MRDMRGVLRDIDDASHDDFADNASNASRRHAAFSIEHQSVSRTMFENVADFIPHHMPLRRRQKYTLLYASVPQSYVCRSSPLKLFLGRIR